MRGKESKEKDRRRSNQINSGKEIQANVKHWSALGWKGCEFTLKHLGHRLSKRIVSFPKAFKQQWKMGAGKKIDQSLYSGTLCAHMSQSKSKYEDFHLFMDNSSVSVFKWCQIIMLIHNTSLSNSSMKTAFWKAQPNSSFSLCIVHSTQILSNSCFAALQSQRVPVSTEKIPCYWLVEKPLPLLPVCI